MKALLRISTATQDQNVKAKYQQYVKTSVLSDKSYNQNDQLKSYADIQMMKKLINDTSIHIKNKPQQIKYTMR